MRGFSADFRASSRSRVSIFARCETSPDTANSFRSTINPHSLEISDKQPRTAWNCLASRASSSVTMYCWITHSCVTCTDSASLAFFDSSCVLCRANCLLISGCFSSLFADTSATWRVLAVYPARVYASAGGIFCLIFSINAFCLLVSFSLIFPPYFYQLLHQGEQ